MRKQKSHERKAKSVSISMPAYLAEVLEHSPNKSRIVVQILEENFSRISNGEVEELLNNRERQVRMVFEPILKEAMENIAKEVFEAYKYEVKHD